MVLWWPSTAVRIMVEYQIQIFSNIYLLHNYTIWYSTFGEVWRPTEELIVAKPGNFGIVWMCSGPSLMPRKSLNLVWNFFLQYFWKYCQKKKVAHPSFLLGCSKPSERFFALNSNIFPLFVCWDIYLVQFSVHVCAYNIVYF